MISHAALVQLLRAMPPGAVRYLPPRLSGTRNGLILTRYRTPTSPSGRPEPPRTAVQNASSDTPGATS